MDALLKNCSAGRSGECIGGPFFSTRLSLLRRSPLFSLRGGESFFHRLALFSLFILCWSSECSWGAGRKRRGKSARDWLWVVEALDSQRKPALRSEKETNERWKNSWQKTPTNGAIRLSMGGMTAGRRPAKKFHTTTPLAGHFFALFAIFSRAACILGRRRKPSREVGWKTTQSQDHEHKKSSG